MAVEMEVDGRYDNLELQNIDDTIYEDLRTTTKKEKDLLKILRADTRRYKRVGASLGLFCAVLALLNVAVPLQLYQSNMVERQRLLSSFDELQNRHNILIEQKDQLLSSLEAKYGKLEARYDKLETTRYDLLTEEREQLQNRINNLTKERDDMKSCEPGWQRFDRGCYYISTEKKSWDVSRQWCLDRQSDLIVIKSKEKQDFVEGLNKRVWLGLTDRVREGSFQWVDGTPLTLTTPTYWMPGEPTNARYGTGEEQNCVQYYDGSEASWTSVRGWDDQYCGKDSYWICERVLC